MDENINVTAICRRCGKPSPVNKLVLDPFYKMVVCSTCVVERTGRGVVSKSTLSSAAKDKPRILSSGGPRRIIGSVGEDKRKIEYSCRKCKYKFYYNRETNYPSKCPYCKSPVHMDV